MANLKIAGSIDSQDYLSFSVVNSEIPIGSIILFGGSAYSVSQLANVDSNGFSPCDGRALNTYKYRELHKVVSNYFGGTAYSAGVTDSSTAITTFNVPTLNAELSYIAGSSDAILPKTDAGSNTHTHATNTNASGNTTSGSFPHSHSVALTYNGGGDHGVGHGAAWVGVNATSAHNAAVTKNDGSCAGAAINHSHTSIYRENIAGNSGNHAHSVNATVGDNLDTLHSHSFTTSSSLANSTVTPLYTGALFFIKV